MDVGQVTYEEDGVDGSVGSDGAVEHLGVCEGVGEGNG